ncbi:MAG TPA: RNA polymerase sigma factor [Solirubrobacteraceae bacterium]|nr:RNA polymerase sigma factor [Solirubrobacteraceae bacterium]
MEVSALRYSGGIGLHARSPLLRLQSDERLVALIRRGSTTAFEVLVSRYHARLLAFCRHLLGSREDAEDVLQEVFSAAFNAMLDDDRPINVRPWLYRIARNRSLNHLRRIQAVGVDSMDIHLFDHGATTADRVHDREEFRMLVGDIQGLPETQRTALVLREMDALSYEQIAEAMETTVPSVKSLLVRARVSLAEAAQARMLTCEDVRIELGEVAEGLRRRPGPLVRRHLRTCERCAMFKTQLNDTSKALAAVLPIGGFVLLRKLAILHIGHSASAGAGAGSSASGAGASGAAAVGSTAAAGATAMIGSTGGGFLSASVGAIATKAAAGLAAAALVTAGAVEVDQPARSHVHHRPVASNTIASVPAQPIAITPTTTPHVTGGVSAVTHIAPIKHPHKAAPAKKASATAKKPAKPTSPTTGKADAKAKPTVPPGRTQTQTDATVLPGSATPSVAAAGSAGTASTTSTTTSTPAPTPSATTTPPSSDPSTTTTSTDPTTTTTTATDPTSTDPGTTTPTTTTTTPTTTTPAPAPTDDPAAGISSAGTPATSGGIAPYPVWRDRDWGVSSRRHAGWARHFGRRIP